MGRGTTKGRTVYTADGRPVELVETTHPFFGAIDPGANTFVPNFKSLRQNGSRELILAILGKEGCEVMGLNEDEPNGYDDISHEMLDSIIETELELALRYA
jgi:hypothetical protein